MATTKPNSLSKNIRILKDLSFLLRNTLQIIYYTKPKETPHEKSKVLPKP